MTEMLRRDELVELLNKLGSEDEGETLEAARQAHARIAAAGVSWEDLLVPDDAAAENNEPAEEPTEEPAEEPADESGETEDGELGVAEDESPAERTGAGGTDQDAESLALIGELLARSDISAELRSELEDYKTDIAEGEFVAADRRYLRAVRQRLKK